MKKCEAENKGICMSMLCLLDTDCNGRMKDGKPNYDYLYSIPAKKGKK